MDIFKLNLNILKANTLFSVLQAQTLCLKLTGLRSECHLFRESLGLKSGKQSGLMVLILWMASGNSGRTNRALNSIKQNIDYFNYKYKYICITKERKRKLKFIFGCLATKSDGRLNVPILQIPHSLFILNI